MLFRLLFCLAASCLLGACVSSMPTADRLDELEQTVRAEHAPYYAELDSQRRAGALSAEDYKIARAGLDKRVQNKVDSMLWSRHALVQSDLKANGVPTPDRPQDNLPPGVGSMTGSLYNSTRQNGLGNQMVGEMMQRNSSTSFGGNPRRAGTMYDEP